MSADDQHAIDMAQSPMIGPERAESESDKRRFDVKRYLPTALRPQDKTQPPSALLDPRFYAMKKTAMTIMCLLIIIMSNSVQLKHVLRQGSSHSFYGTQVTLGILSVFMCASIGLIQIYILCTRLDIYSFMPSSPSSSSSAAAVEQKKTLCSHHQFVLLIPAALTIVLVFLDMTFFIILFFFFV